MVCRPSQLSRWRCQLTSVTYLPISTSVQQTIATLIIDGIFDKFPKLRWGVRAGASWLPGWLRNLDSAAHFRKNEERLQNLSAKPSETRTTAVTLAA